MGCPQKDPVCWDAPLLIAAGTTGLEKLSCQKVKKEDYVDIWLSPLAFVEYKHFAGRWDCAAPLIFFLISYLIESTFDQD